jgi:putative addiction module component (TIGR02574 family)
MPTAERSLSQRALKLSARKRMSLAALLLESMPDDDGVDQALLAELKRRAADLHSGKLKGLSTEQAYGFSL